jgi:hypothetical protein
MVEIVAWATSNVLSAVLLAVVVITVGVVAYLERQGFWRK